MASRDPLVVEQPIALQSVQSSEQKKQPTLVEGNFQLCEGHIERKSKILKRWKKEYIKVIPGTSLFHWLLSFSSKVQFCHSKLSEAISSVG